MGPGGRIGTPAGRGAAGHVATDGENAAGLATERQDSLGLVAERNDAAGAAELFAAVLVWAHGDIDQGQTGDFLAGAFAESFLRAHESFVLMRVL